MVEGFPVGAGASPIIQLDNSEIFWGEKGLKPKAKAKQTPRLTSSVTGKMASFLICFPATFSLPGCLGNKNKQCIDAFLFISKLYKSKRI